MKKVGCFIITIILCMTFLWGCAQCTPEVDTQEKFCRVMCLKDDGMVVWIENLEYVYIERVETDLEIEPSDTVVMQISEETLKPAQGNFVDFLGTERTYSYTLESPISIRYPTAEEPTFG